MRHKLCSNIDIFSILCIVIINNIHHSHTFISEVIYFSPDYFPQGAMR